MKVGQELVIKALMKAGIKEGFFRDFLTLLSGTALAQSIPVLLAPLLARLYEPDDFGMLSLFLSITTVIGVIATLRFEFAIVIPKDETDARSLYLLSLIMAVLISIFSLIGVFIFKYQIISYFGTRAIGDYLYLIPAMVLFTGIYQASNYWSTRNKTFRLNAIARVNQSVFTIGFQTGMVWVQKGFGGLITGAVIGQLASAIILAWQVLKKPSVFFKGVSFHRIIMNAGRYRAFAGINTPHALLDAFQYSLIVFLFQYYFDAGLLGLYAFAFRIMKAPLGIVGSSVSQVFYEKASRMAESGESIRPFLWRLQINLFAISILPFIALLFFAPDLFELLFTVKFREAGVISQYLIPWIFLNFLLSPFAGLPVILNKQKGAFLITIVDFFLKTTSIVIGGVLSDYRIAFFCLSISGSLLNLFSLAWFYKISAQVVSNAYHKKNI